MLVLLQRAFINCTGRQSGIISQRHTIVLDAKCDCSLSRQDRKTQPKNQEKSFPYTHTDGDVLRGERETGYREQIHKSLASKTGFAHFIGGVRFLESPVKMASTVCV